MSEEHISIRTPVALDEVFGLAQRVEPNAAVGADQAWERTVSFLGSRLSRSRAAPW